MPDRMRLIIESFDASRHDRDNFTSGVTKADNFLKLTANKLSKAGHLRIRIATEDRVSILGFLALNVGAVDYMELPKRFARDHPSSGLIPAAYIAMIGVAKTQQGKGIGRFLLTDALKRVAYASEYVGMSITMLDILDDGDEKAIEARHRLYTSFGFRSFQANRLKMWVPTKDIERD
jgi:ribosomal protein S18 acetylase RimI-like enzyme